MCRCKSGYSGDGKNCSGRALDHMYLVFVLVYLTRMMLINLNSTLKVIYHKLRKYDLITLATLHMIFILLATLAGNVNSSLRSLSGECCCVCEVSLMAPPP